MHRFHQVTMGRARLGLAVAAVAISACASVAGASPPRTQTRIYEAFTSAGTPAIHVTKTVHGSCNGGSAAIDRNDAWRCFFGNYVADPCFSSSAAKGIVLCPTAAWSSSGTEIKLTRPLADGDTGKPSISGQPWAVETTSGTKCQIDTGATSVVDHQRANYFCQKGKDVLWGAPSRKAEPWTIYAAPATATKLTKKVKLSVAWF